MSFKDMTKKEILEDYTTVINRAEELDKELTGLLRSLKMPLGDFYDLAVGELVKWQEKYRVQILGLSIDSDNLRTEEKE